MNINIFILTLFISAILSFILAIYIWRRREGMVVPSLGGILISISIWTFAGGLELMMNTLEQKFLLTTICYLGILQLPVWFFHFSVEYTGFIVLKKEHKYLLWALPSISLVMLLTNDYHNLFFNQVKLDVAGSNLFLKIEYGKWWWIHASYSYLLILGAIFLLLRSYYNSSLKHRYQLSIILAITTLPIISNIIYISGFRPFGFVDPTPLAFAITGILFFWGIHSKSLFSVKPIALDTLFSNLPDGIVVIDNDNVVVDLNNAAVNILELVNSQISGDHIENIFPPFRQAFNKSIKTVSEIDFNGKSIDFSHSPMINYSGQVAGSLLIFRDVTDRKLAETQLKATQDRFELAIMAAGLDPWENNLVTGSREGGEKIYLDMGYKPQELPRSIDDIFNLIHPEDLPLVKMRINNHLLGKTDIYTSDFRIRDRKGNYQWVTNFGRIVEKDKDGNAIRFIGLTLNINERKKSEEKIKKQNEELIKAIAEKDKFFSIIAHDLRGPFQGFIGLTELMSESISNMNQDEIRDVSHALQGTAKNLYELLDNLLNWAMVKRGHKRFNVESVKLAFTVDSLMETVKPQILNKNHTIINHIDSNTSVLADRETLKTVLRNLVSNAIKFTPIGGRIEVSSLDKLNGFIEISVKDSGIGMPPEIKDNLFNINQKVSRNGTNDEPSTGLGLILCKELIEKHGGVIWVDSKPDEGSDFRFTLPKEVNQKN